MTTQQAETFADGGSAAIGKASNSFPLGTRASQLALVQTHLVADTLNAMHTSEEYTFPVAPMSVLGDRNKQVPLYLLSGSSANTPAKSLWTEELEEALIKGEVDMIVHSLKDVPTQLPDECEIGAILEREDPRDALIVKQGLPYKTLDEMPEGSVIGTSSVRRIAQLRKTYPRLKVMDVVSFSGLLSL
jgi:hydroxymethylbilane synthase